MRQRFRLLHLHSPTNLRATRGVGCGHWPISQQSWTDPQKGTWTSPGLATLEEFLTPVRDHAEWSKLGLPPGIAFRSRRRLTMGATRHPASFVISLSRVLLWSSRIGARLSRPRSR